MDINKVSDTTKNVFYLILLVGQAVLAYAQIYSNQSDITQLKIDIDKDFELYSKRSDKRYKRALNMGKDHEERLRKVERDLTFIQGKENY